jgi:hypothetical protein
MTSLDGCADKERRKGKVDENFIRLAWQHMLEGKKEKKNE